MYVKLTQHKRKQSAKTNYTVIRIDDIVEMFEETYRSEEDDTQLVKITVLVFRHGGRAIEVKESLDGVVEAIRLGLAR